MLSKPSLTMSRLLIALTVGVVATAGVAYTTINATSPAPTAVDAAAYAAADIQWMTWDQAVKATKANPKPLLIDVYTDWCGWCKRMDQTTFKDPKVVQFVADNFYAVKFDAEQKEDIVYDGNTFTFQKTGQRGVHTLAASLLDGRLSYPSVVYLNGNMERIMISPGFKDADAILGEMKQAAGK